MMTKLARGPIRTYVLILLCTAALAQADYASSARSISLSQAIEQTVASNPELIAFGYQIEAQEGRVTQSGLRPNPELGLEVENFMRTGQRSAVDTAETTLSMSWFLERGKREKRVDASRARVSMLESEAMFRRLNVAAETAQLFLESLVTQERARQREDAVTLAEEVVSAVKRRVEAGHTPKAELSRAKADLARARLRAEDTQHELHTAYRRLAAQWGDSEPLFGRVAGDLYNLPSPDGFPHLMSRIDENPQLRNYLARHQMREAELELARAEARPNWNVTAGVRRFELGDDYALVAGLTIPVATSNRNQGRIAEAEARLAGTSAEEAALRIQLETRLFARYQELQHDLHRAETLRENVLPNVEQALADTERAYEVGRYGYLELRQVQADLLATRREILETAARAHQNAIEIERLTGTTLASPENQP